ncbi:protein FAM161B [Scomber japonicus]|uniref:protein FAM161B n=1 Tax=Scomber japonicus TaxID=13676 RepID=UPI002305D3AD|nr:protein FAM161B [Scomber japonicus]
MASFNSTDQKNMSTLETLQEDGLRSELMLQQQLSSLREALKQQLQETEMRQREELDRRIHHNTLLSKDLSSDKNEPTHQTQSVGLRRSTSAPALPSDKVSNHPRQLERPNSSAPAWVSSSNWRQCSGGTSKPTRAPQCEGAPLFKTSRQRKEAEAEAECKKKFCALPVPDHVSLPLYREMVELREKERKQGHEQRKHFLLSVQKPFSFQEREKEKREKMMAMVNEVSQDQKHKTASAGKSPHKRVKDTDQELSSKVHAQTTLFENPTASGGPRLRTAERSKKEKLGFLDEKPSFHPKIIHQVPDFSRLHKALQTEVLRKPEIKDVTKCQPFHLRTSALPARQSRLSLENSKVANKSNLRKSKSFGALTSLSTDTIPTYITDATRKRGMAIRKSMEMRDTKNQESSGWLRKYQQRSEAMRKTVALHAKLLDPHNSLKEVHNEKLQHHRESDQKRMKEYMKELRDMKARVSERPYLFEQVKQRNAKANAEKTYRNKLKKAGIQEQFVEENGEADEGASTSSRSEDDTDGNDHSRENDIHSGYAEEENVDDGEKIEDVEEKSVKSKGEEMP